MSFVVCELYINKKISNSFLKNVGSIQNGECVIRFFNQHLWQNITSSGNSNGRVYRMPSASTEHKTQIVIKANVLSSFSVFCTVGVISYLQILNVIDDKH